MSHETHPELLGRMTGAKPHKEIAVEQQGAWDVRVVIERKGVAAQSGIEAISAVTAQLDREGIVVAEVHAHRAAMPAVETRAGE